MLSLAGRQQRADTCNSRVTPAPRVKMKASETSLQRIIEGQNQYVVPLFQRTYSWDTKEWTVLWDDIAELCEEEVPRKHFMGSIVTMPTQSVPEGVAKYLLIDGQQRMTTILLLLAALRDRATELGVGTLAPEIEQTLLKNVFKQGTEAFKLLPTQGDRTAFTQIILAQKPEDGAPITKAYRFFGKVIRANDYDLEKLKRIIVNNLVLVSIVLDRDDNPHLIFESLNAKGRALSQADLIRNYFFMRIHVDEQEKLYVQYWKPMQESLGTDLTECIRHFLMRDGPNVKQGEIYFALKDHADRKSSAEVLNYLQEVVRFAGYYAKLLHPEREPDPAIRERMSRLNRIEVTTAYPFLLNVYDDYAGGRISKGRFLEVLDALENFTVRRWVCAVPTYGLNKIFPPLYGQAKSRGDFVMGLKEVLSTKNYPPDAEFRTRLTSNKLYGQSERVTKTKLILERIEQSFEHREAVDPETLTIEHVMPQTPTAWWQEHLGEAWQVVHDTLLHTLGNLTLTGYNGPLSNDPFPAKRAILAKSHLELNRSFEMTEAWGQQDIKHRADVLAERALTIWPYFGSPEPVVDAPDQNSTFDAAGLRTEAIERVSRYLGTSLVKVGPANFSSKDGDIRIVCLASQPYEQSNGTNYWFGSTPAHKEFLVDCKAGFIALACGSASRVIVLRSAEFIPALENMHQTAGQHWHIRVFWRDASVSIEQTRGKVNLDVSKHIIPALGV